MHRQSLLVAAAFVALLPVSLLAMAEKSSLVPTPRPKAVDRIPVVVEVTAPAAHAAIPLPRPKPLDVRFATGSLPSTVDGAEATPRALNLPLPKSYGSWPRSKVEDARESCAKLLRGLDVRFKALKPIGRPGGCGIAYPLEVSSIAGVKVSPPATINCRMASTLHEWLQEDVQSIAARELNAHVVGIENASSYACRRRNNASSGKMSEHALGNALDIAEFRFEKKARIAVVGGWSGFLPTIPSGRRGQFLRQVRKTACGEFNTVLGPGSDAFHKNHIHVDLMKLRPGRGKYCR